MTFHLSNLLSTQQITHDSEYFESPEGFFLNFSEAWKTVETQVLKLETRQFYYEPYDEKSSESFRYFKENNIQEAKSLIYYFRSGDVNLYHSLKERKVDFIRCRTVEQPVTEYLRWEIECYHFNSFHGEKIFFLKKEDLKEVFTNLALHDFMVFDRKIAFIHNYNQFGEIQGGWVVKNSSHIDNLIMLYSIIRTSSVEYSVFLKNLII